MCGSRWSIISCTLCLTANMTPNADSKDASDEDLEAGVRTWLHTKGFPLEMRVARTLAAHGGLVDQGIQYADVTTGTIRESDVRATFLRDDDAGAHLLSLVIECKSTTSPWVLFVGGERDYDPWSAPGVEDDTCDDCARLVPLGADAWLRETQLGYAITEKRTDKGQARDKARDAVMAVTSAAISALRWELDHQASMRTAAGNGSAGSSVNLAVHRALVLVPTVVTTSPLFACALDEDGNVQLQRVRRGVVSVMHEQSPEPLSVLVLVAEDLGSFAVAARAVTQSREAVARGGVTGSVLIDWPVE